MLQKEIVELKLKRKRTDLSSKSSSSGSSTHRVPQPKLLRSSAKANVRGSVQKVPQTTKVSDRTGNLVTRQKVGVSGPGYSSDHSSDDTALGDGKVRQWKKSSDGVLGDGDKTVRKTKVKKSIAVAALSSDEESAKLKRRPRTKCVVGFSDDAKLKQKRRSRTKTVVSSGDDKVKRHSRRKLVLSSSDEGSKVKRHTRRKALVASSDEEKLKSKRRTQVKPVVSSSDDQVKRHSRKRSSSSVSSSSDERAKSKRRSRKSHGKVKKDGDGKGCTVGELRDAWRREFKMKGQIGKIGDKENKLDYLSVKRQITRGVEKGYKDAEIIEGVINCTTPGTTIRSFLQSSEDLTIPILLDILRSYFQEADTVDLLQRLATAHQGSREDAQTFLMACLDLKNRIVRNEDDDIGFSRETVMKILLKTLESGLSDDRILNSIRPSLSNPAVSDNVLISEMSHAVMLEKKRKEKSKSAPRVAFVEADETSSDAVEIARLQRQLDDLREEKEADSAQSDQLAQLQASINKLVNGKHRQYGCKDCKKDGKGKTCSHCFVCGKGDHKVVDCPKKKEKEDKDESLNSNRSPARDI